MQPQFLDTDSEEEQPLKKKQKVQCQQDCSDSIPSLPPSMPPWSQLKNSRYSQGSSGEATNGISVVEPQMTRATFSHNEFDESTIHKSGITSSTPVYEGGFFANFPDLHVSYSNPCLPFGQPCLLFDSNNRLNHLPSYTPFSQLHMLRDQLCLPRQHHPHPQTHCLDLPNHPPRTTKNQEKLCLLDDITS